MRRPPGTLTVNSLVDRSHGAGLVSSRRDGSSEEDAPALASPPPRPSYHELHRPIKVMTSTLSSHPLQEKSVPTPGTSSKSFQPRKDEWLGKQSTDTPIPSVHPIDTLSKKLRQQAMELTHVYEELEKQNLQIKSYKTQLQDQKRELDQLREQRRKVIENHAKTPNRSRKGALDQQKCAAQLMSGTSCTGASLGQKREELDCKLKEVERDKKKYQLAAKRIEKALAELRVFQNDRMGKLLTSDKTPNQEVDATANASTMQQILDEQQAYIRVLEEAVHLKATEFEITGHEELLIVLAELRHTIYEQENDVEEKNKVLVSSQEQHDLERQQQLEKYQDLEVICKQHKSMASQAREDVQSLEQQLLDKVREVNELQSIATDAQRAQEASHNRLQAAMTTQNVTQTKVEDVTRKLQACTDKLEKSTVQFEAAQREVERLETECTTKQTHLDELNALQEGVLGSVDKYVCKVQKARDKVKLLKKKLKEWKEKDRKAQSQLKDVASVSDERMNALQAEMETTKLCMQELQAQDSKLKRENATLEGTIAEVKEEFDRQIQARDIMQEKITVNVQRCSQVDKAVTEMETALSSVMTLLSKTDQPQVEAKDHADGSEADEHEFVLNRCLLHKFQTCCQALDTFPTSHESRQNVPLCRLLAEVIARVATVNNQVEMAVERAFASWTRERKNLVEACATLETTAALCQHEMEERHDELRECREQLVMRESEIQENVVQLNSLHEQLRGAYAECKAFRALQERVEHQDEGLKEKQSIICNLSVENDRLVALEKASMVQMAAKTRQIETQQATILEQKRFAEECDEAFEKAAAFAEAQNECNYQLQSQLFEMKRSQQVQLNLVKTLQEQLSSFSKLLLKLIQRYTRAVRSKAASDPRVQDYLQVLEAEIQNGNVVCLLQLFPALLEQYTASCKGHSKRVVVNTMDETQWKGIAQGATTNSNQMNPLSKTAIEVGVSTLAIDSPVSTLSAKVDRIPHSFFEAEKDDAGIAEQWKVIREAFQSYRINSDR